ncbi:MAG: ABC transporter permease, partial [Oceanococcaceae bacterium]
RGGMRQDSGRTLPRKTLQGHRGWAATAGLLLFVGSVVGLPVLTLLRWSMEHIRVEWDARYLVWLGHSLQLAGLRLGTLGYALPGTLIAVGLFAPLAALERGLGPWISPGWLTQSLLLVLLGYWARFLAVAHTPLAQQLTRIRPSIDEVSRTLGVRGLRLLGRVHVPLVSGAMGSAAALLVIDIIKEMPITLMTRPSGFDTLATRVFELTAEGEYERAALPALTIVLAGLLPVALLLRLGHKEPGNPHAT